MKVLRCDRCGVTSDGAPTLGWLSLRLHGGPLLFERALDVCPECLPKVVTAIGGALKEPERS